MQHGFKKWDAPDVKRMERKNMVQKRTKGGVVQGELLFVGKRR